jgi:hypothetical protein
MWGGYSTSTPLPTDDYEIMEKWKAQSPILRYHPDTWLRGLTAGISINHYFTVVATLT